MANPSLLSDLVVNAASLQSALSFSVMNSTLSNLSLTASSTRHAPLLLRSGAAWPTRKVSRNATTARPNAGQNVLTSSSEVKDEIEERAQRARLANAGSVMTDETVPEGHKGLHGFLYGESGADVHDAADDVYKLREGEDDGSQILPLDTYVAVRDSTKFAGVYAVYDAKKDLQYVGYSRNVVLSLKAHRSRVGEEKCAYVRVLMYTDATLVSRTRLEEERQTWLSEEAMPAGNSTEIHLWEGPNGAGTAAMSEEERTLYEEKKLKMRKAMGENLYDDVEGESGDSRDRRLRLLQATEGDDWSSVIDGQTSETLVDPRLPPLGAGAEPAVDAQIVSPFMRPGAPPMSQGAPAGAITVEMTVGSVDEALNEVRPYLIADGGNVEVVGVEAGVVLLRLQGACGTCPSSTATMKMGIERLLVATFGEQLKEVMQVDKIDISASVAGVNAHLDLLRPAIQNWGGSVNVLSVDSTRGVCEVEFKGPPTIGMGIQAAIKDKFPDIRTVNLVTPSS